MPQEMPSIDSPARMRLLRRPRNASRQISSIKDPCAHPSFSSANDIHNDKELIAENAEEQRTTGACLDRQEAAAHGSASRHGSAAGGRQPCAAAVLRPPAP